MYYILDNEELPTDNLIQESQDLEIQFAIGLERERVIHQKEHPSYYKYYYKAISPFCLCKDFIGDIVASILTKKPFNIYGLVFNPPPEAALDNIVLLIKLPKNNIYKRWRREPVLPHISGDTSLFHVMESSKTHYYMVGHLDKRWWLVPCALSFLLLFLRIYGLCGNMSWDDKLSVIKSLAISDSSKVRALNINFVKWILENIDRLAACAIWEDFNTVEIKQYHNYYGVVGTKGTFDYMLMVNEDSYDNQPGVRRSFQLFKESYKEG